MHALSQEALTALAAELAQADPAEIIKVRAAGDDTLVVIINPGPKFIYTARQVAEAAERLRAAAGQAAAAIIGAPALAPAKARQRKPASPKQPPA